MTAEEERLLQALEMFDDGVRIMRENLRRQRPHASEDEIDRALDAWLTERPCDADGVLVPGRAPCERHEPSRRDDARHRVVDRLLDA